MTRSEPALTLAEGLVWPIPRAGACEHPSSGVGGPPAPRANNLTRIDSWSTPRPARGVPAFTIWRARGSTTRPTFGAPLRPGGEGSRRPASTATARSRPPRAIRVCKAVPRSGRVTAITPSARSDTTKPATLHSSTTGGQHHPTSVAGRHDVHRAHAERPEPVAHPVELVFGGRHDNHHDTMPEPSARTAHHRLAANVVGQPGPLGCHQAPCSPHDRLRRCR